MTPLDTGGADPWDEHAAWWQRGFTEGADPEYVEQILPLIAANLPRDARVLDLGCGEGQVCRLAHSLGCVAVGVDASRSQLGEACRRGGALGYLQAAATALPLAPGSVDAAVACLVLEHVADLDGALAEVAGALRSGGRFLLLMNHPLTQTPNSGWVDDHLVDPPEQYWQLGPYLSEAETLEEVERGVRIRFFHRPLSRYLNAAFEVGLVLERMEEPAPPPGFLALAPEYESAVEIPRLLYLRFERR